MQAARRNQLDPLVGRDAELRRLTQILLRRTKNNPVLVGEPGGLLAVVGGLVGWFEREGAQQAVGAVAGLVVLYRGCGVSSITRWRADLGVAVVPKVPHTP